MTRAGVLMFAALLLAAAPATAQGKKKVKVTIEIEFEELKALTELPTTVEEAADAGSTEVEIKKAFDAMKVKKIKGKPAKAIGVHFKTQAEKDLSDEGLGDVVRECVDEGHKDEDLVACVTGEWKKKPAKKRKHPVVKAKPAKKKPPAALKAKKPVAVPSHVLKAGGKKKHKGTATSAAKKKKKSALKK
jgi:hypothetical protein